eukprot:gene8363-biopygen13662
MVRLSASTRQQLRSSQPRTRSPHIPQHQKWTAAAALWDVLRDVILLCTEGVGTGTGTIRDPARLLILQPYGCRYGCWYGVSCALSHPWSARGQFCSCSSCCSVPAPQ